MARSDRGRPRRKGGRPAQALAIEVIVQSARWKAQPRAVAVVRKAVQIAGKAASTPRGELAIVLTNDSAIRALNRDWRGLDAPTNVLSFPAKPLPRHARASLGDIIIAFETTAREAAGEGKRFQHHLAHLAVHGFLHLLGYDHESDREARTMERLEIEILARLKVPDPYAAAAARR